MSQHLLLSSIPNLITLARLIAVPLMVWLIATDALSAAFWLFVAAGVSDGVDGYIAKRFRVESELGSYLDPIADKVMLVGVYVTLGLQSYLSLWLVILVVFRDVLIVGGTVLSQLIDRPVKMQPLFISKVNTVAQIVLAAVVLAELTYKLAGLPLISAMEYLVATTTVISGSCYLYMWVTGRGAFIDAPAPAQRSESARASTEDQPRGRV